jgi:hypothetical protein
MGRAARRGPERAAIIAVLVAVVTAGLAAGLSPAKASTAETDSRASADATEPDALPPEGDLELTGREIYERVLENRFDTFIQASSLVSGDRGGNAQETRLRMWFKSFDEDPEADPSAGEVLSKTLVRYSHPFEIRHTSYLIINKYARPNDQFVYLNSQRRVRRVNLRGEAVFGTDFSFEDIVPRELEDADYRRHPDAELDGVPCYVVEAIPRPDSDSEYSRFLSHVEKERNVPLLVRYWDDRGLEIKELRVRRESIERVEDVWVPMHMTMRNLRHDTFTTLVIEELEPNPTIAHAVFDLRRLETH